MKDHCPNCGAKPPPGNLYCSRLCEQSFKRRLGAHAEGAVIDLAPFIRRKKEGAL